MIGGCGQRDDPSATDHVELRSSAPPPILPPPPNPTLLPQVSFALQNSPKVDAVRPTAQPKVTAVDPPNAPIHPKAMPTTSGAVAVDPPNQLIQSKVVKVNPVIPTTPQIPLEAAQKKPDPLDFFGNNPLVPVPATDTNPFDNERINHLLISDNPDDNLMVLNEALKIWLMKNRGLPEMLGNLVGKQYLPMLPMAPLGKVFAIDRESNSVVLVTEK